MAAQILSEAEIQSRLKVLSDWKIQGKEITKQFQFADFVHAMGFVNSVALVAERANHHPDIDVRWNKVTLTLSTHSAGGLTEQDFSLATTIDGL